MNFLTCVIDLKNKLWRLLIYFRLILEEICLKLEKTLINSLILSILKL